VTLAGGSASITAVGAERRVARVLDLQEGEPVLRVSQTERAADGTLVLHSEEHYVPNLFELTIRRTRRGRGVA
jgi:DNA-binding GntR family transcriptional regulator